MKAYKTLTEEIQLLLLRATQKPIDINTICQIIGDLNQVTLKGNPDKNIKNVVASWSLRQLQDDYVLRIEKGFHKHGIQGHVTINKMRSIYVPEASSQYRTSYKITIKNLIINVTHGGKSESMFFDTLDSEQGEVGIYLVFENNLFVTKKDVTIASFHPARLAYLIFKNNRFESVNMYLQTYNSYKVELTDNIFIDSSVEIRSESGSMHTNHVHPNVVCLENNTFHRNDDIFSELRFKGEKDTKCYFKGKNTVDNLIISTDGYLNWGGYQNIDPQSEHAYTHKQMFIDLMKKAIDKNDKMQETQLRRELLKCERTLIREEEFWRSLQDRFILWWSSWISDYGISWFRPFRLLVYMNALLTLAIVYFFKLESSSWLLFFEFFNPLSSLSDMINIKGCEWIIAAINVVQKALLAVFLYEMIKIFRRFSK